MGLHPVPEEILGQLDGAVEHRGRLGHRLLPVGRPGEVGQDQPADPASLATFAASVAVRWMSGG